MAQQYSRQVVQDPLAGDPALNGAAKQLGMGGGGNPHQSGGDVSGDKLDGLFGQLGNVLAADFQNKKDEYVTAGKIAYMSGVTDASLIRGGNKYTSLGWQTLAAADKANQWYNDSVVAIGNTDEQMDPADYQKQLMKSRAAQLANLPNDPDVRKVYSDAFEQLGPKLSALQTNANSLYNQKQTATQFGLALSSMAGVNPGRSQYAPDLPNLAQSADVVSKPATLSGQDRDAVVRTVLGEASQGASGQAAVAQVIKNRLQAGSYGGTAYDVVHSKNQFSAWNDAAHGGNGNVSSYGPGSALYDKAGRVVDAVFGGHVVDQTGGATQYLSESAMQATGAALPAWFTQHAGGKVTIGGNTFLAKGATPGATPVLAGSEKPTGASLEERDAADQAKKTHQSMVEDFVRNYPGMKPTDKANALADAMQRQLAAGDDTLWNDAGGVSMLYQMGADPGAIDGSLSAKTQYDTKKANDFNIDTERQSQSIVDMAKNGANATTIQNAVNSLYQTKVLDSQHANALLSQAMSQVYTSPKSANPQFQSELANIYQAQQEGGDFIKATNALSWVAAKYGVPQKETDAIVGTMASIENGNRNALITKAQAAATKAAQEENTKKIVDTALSSGHGLDNINELASGTITIKNANGTTSQVTPKDYGIMQVRAGELKALQTVVAEHPDQAQAAAGLLDQRVYTTLAKQNVVDTAQASNMTAALTGDLLNPDGTVAQSALAAYDLYKRMATNPEIGEGYAKQYLTTDSARALAETARSLDSGRQDQSMADVLRKANEQMKQKLTTPTDAANANMTFDAQSTALIKDGLTKAMNTDWFPWLLQGNDISDVEKSAVLANTGAAEAYVASQAKTYQMQLPQLPAQTHVNMAIQDLTLNSRIVLGNLVVGKDGTTISNDMGLGGLDKFGPDRALKHYLDADAGNGKTLGEVLWGPQWINYKPRFNLNPSLGNPVDALHDMVFGPPVDAYGNRTGVGPETANGVTGLRRDTTDQTLLDPQGYHHAIPPVSVTYSPATKQFTLRLWKDDARTMLATDEKGQPFPARTLDASAVGDAYLKELRQPTWLENTTTSVGDMIHSAIARPLMGPDK